MQSLDCKIDPLGTLTTRRTPRSLPPWPCDRTRTATGYAAAGVVPTHLQGDVARGALSFTTRAAGHADGTSAALERCQSGDA